MDTLYGRFMGKSGAKHQKNVKKNGANNPINVIFMLLPSTGLNASNDRTKIPHVGTYAGHIGHGPVPLQGVP